MGEKYLIRIALNQSIYQSNNYSNDYYSIWRLNNTAKNGYRRDKPCNPYNLERLFIKPWEPWVFSIFSIIIPILVSCIRLIWIPMLWVYDHYIYIYIKFSTVPALKGLTAFSPGGASSIIRIGFPSLVPISIEELLLACGMRWRLIFNINWWRPVTGSSLKWEQ